MNLDIEYFKIDNKFLKVMVHVAHAKVETCSAQQSGTRSNL